MADAEKTVAQIRVNDVSTGKEIRVNITQTKVATTSITVKVIFADNTYARFIGLNDDSRT